MTTTINQIAEQAMAYTADDPDGGLEREEILKLLDTKGTENEHLANPLNRDPEVFYERPRETAFTGDEAVHGDYLLLDFCGHNPSMVLFDFPSLQDLEAAILGGGGITNIFTTYQLAFRSGRLTPYDIFFQSSSGDRAKFNKRDQSQEDASAQTAYPNAEICWR